MSSLLDSILKNTTQSDSPKQEIQPAKDYSNLTGSQLDIYNAIETGFPFDVTKLPIPNPVDPSKPTNAYACFRSDTGHVVGGVVGKDYNPHTKGMVVDLALVAGDVLLDPKIKTSFNDGHRVRVTSAEKIQLDAGDEVSVNLMINSGYGGKGSHRASFAIGNHLCTNLQCFQELQKCSVTIQHSSQLEKKHAELVDKFSELAGNLDQFESLANAMNETPVNILEVFNRVVPRTEKNETRWDNIIRSIVARLHSETQRTQDDVPETSGSWLQATEGITTAWRAYNAIQGFYQHDSHRSKTNTDAYNEKRAWNTLTHSKVLETEKVLLAS